MLIFDYVTQYVLKNEKAPELETFKFGDFDDFVSFLDTKKFKYDSESEKLLKKLKENAEKEKYLGTIQGELKAMESKIQSDKKNDLLKHKAEIVGEIEREIVARHYFEKGQIKITLRNDSELTEAIQLLKDPTRYRSMLKK
jgi:carboxyl-terminal processing protease